MAVKTIKKVDAKYLFNKYNNHYICCGNLSANYKDTDFSIKLIYKHIPVTQSDKKLNLIIDYMVAFINAVLIDHDKQPHLVNKNEQYLKIGFNKLQRAYMICINSYQYDFKTDKVYKEFIKEMREFKIETYHYIKETGLEVTTF